MLTRRRVLKTAGTAALLGSVAPARVAFASAPTENRLAFVILRGGLDGLHAVPPYGDRRYRALRPNIAVPPPGEENGALDLNGTFGLHPALAPLQKLYAQKQLLIVQAATTGYTQRSHFDGQNVLENGTNIPYGANDGWLNRALLRLNDGDRRLGLSVGHTVPLVMRGEARVQTWAPTNLPQADDDFLTRLAYVYETDSMLSDALREARRSQEVSSGMMGATRRVAAHAGSTKHCRKPPASCWRHPMDRASRYSKPAAGTPISGKFSACASSSATSQAG